MKFTMDETMKHRLVGIAVIVSIALVFVPAMIKKNNQRLEEKKIVVELPVKPPQPQVASVDKPKVFAQTQVAHVNLDTQKVVRQAESQVKKHPISKPESIRSVSSLSYPLGPEKLDHDPVLSKTTLARHVKKQTPKSVNVAKISHKQSKLTKKVSHKAKKRSASVLKPYSVQIGVFSDNKNALSLKQNLLTQGYHSRLVKTSIRGKDAFKVLVGTLASPEQARQLKLKLAKEAHIQGFVTKGVG